MTTQELCKRTIWEFSRHQGANLAAAIAYYALFSFLPLLLLAIRLLGSSPQATHSLVESIQPFLPSSGRLVQDLISLAANGSRLAGGLSVLGFAFGASQMFVVIEAALNVAWDAPARVWWHSRVGGMLAVGAGLILLLGSVGASLATNLVEKFGVPLERFPLAVGPLVPLMFSALLFILLHKFAPNCQVRWRTAVLAGTLTALLFHLAQLAFSLYLNQVAHLDVLYGSVAGVVMLVLWAYYCAAIIILAAEFAAEFQASILHGPKCARRELRLSPQG